MKATTQEMFDAGKCPVCSRTHKVWPATKHDDAVMDACTGLIWVGDYERLAKASDAVLATV